MFLRLKSEFYNPFSLFFMWFKSNIFAALEDLRIIFTLACETGGEKSTKAQGCDARMPNRITIAGNKNCL